MLGLQAFGFGPEVGLDACMANLMRPGMYNAYHHITIIPNSEQVAGLPDREQDALTSVPLVALEQEMPDNGKDLITKTGIYDVVGGLCENNDKFAVDRALNVEPRPGDVAVIHDSGAHGHSMGFNYNGKPRSAERRTQSRAESSRVESKLRYLYRSDGSVLRIRRAETLEVQDLKMRFPFNTGVKQVLGSAMRLIQRWNSAED